MNPGQDESEREGPFSYHDYDGRPNPGSVDFNGKTFLVDKGHKILGWLTPNEGPEVVELMDDGVQSDFEYVLKKMSAIEGQEGKK